MTPAELAIGVPYLAGEIQQGKIGVGYANLRQAKPAEPALEPQLELGEVDGRLSDIQTTSGPGSAKSKLEQLGALMARATAAEQEFLARLLVGELRQGALESLMIDAIALAAELEPRRVRRAQMLAANLAAVAVAALTEGAAGLEQFTLKLLEPVQPMLAQTAEGVDEALDKLETAALEYKLDGARVQVHRAGQEVRVFTRNLKDVTARVPELVELVRALPASELILDGEIIALGKDGRPLPFQTTMRRFGRKLDVEAMQKRLPLSTFFFDCLLHDGQLLIDEPQRERWRVLEVVAAESLVPQLTTSDADEADAFWAGALARGHEGIMAKAPASSYEAGSRGSGWLKLKPAHTLDLVVLAVEWGSGRRSGWLSNLHLGARNADGGFVMLGKTFKGMTDEMLRWQTEKLLALELGRDGHVVHVKPELVVEIALSDVQESPHYPGGLALRFARVKRYREDKTASDADTIETVRAIHSGAREASRPQRSPGSPSLRG